MSVSVFGIDHGLISKDNSSTTYASPERLASGALFPGWHGAVAGRKHKKARAAAHEVGGAIVGSVVPGPGTLAGAAAGTALAHKKGLYKPDHGSQRTGPLVGGAHERKVAKVYTSAFGVADARLSKSAPQVLARGGTAALHSAKKVARTAGYSPRVPDQLTARVSGGGGRLTTHERTDQRLGSWAVTPSGRSRVTTSDADGRNAYSQVVRSKARLTRNGQRAAAGVAGAGGVAGLAAAERATRPPDQSMAKSAKGVAAVIGGATAAQVGVNEAVRRHYNKQGANVSARAQYRHPYKSQYAQVAAVQRTRSGKLSARGAAADKPHKQQRLLRRANRYAFASQANANAARTGAIAAARTGGANHKVRYDKQKTYTAPSHIQVGKSAFGVADDRLSKAANRMQPLPSATNPSPTASAGAVRLPNQAAATVPAKNGGGPQATSTLKRKTVMQPVTS